MSDTEACTPNETQKLKAYRLSNLMMVVSLAMTTAVIAGLAIGWNDRWQYELALAGVSLLLTYLSVAYHTTGHKNPMSLITMYGAAFSTNAWVAMALSNYP